MIYINSITVVQGTYKSLSTGQANLVRLLLLNDDCICNEVADPLIVISNQY